MTYIEYIPQCCRKEKNNVYQLHSNNIYQLYNVVKTENTVKAKSVYYNELRQAEQSAVPLKTSTQPQHRFSIQG